MWLLRLLRLLGLGQVEHLARHDNIPRQIIYPAEGIDVNAEAQGDLPQRVA
jgi:hypothetical protein